MRQSCLLNEPMYNINISTLYMYMYMISPYYSKKVLLRQFEFNHIKIEKKTYTNQNIIHIAPTKYLVSQFITKTSATIQSPKLEKCPAKIACDRVAEIACDYKLKNNNLTDFSTGEMFVHDNVWKSEGKSFTVVQHNAVANVTTHKHK